MNVYDSETIAEVLAPLNYRQTSELEAADLVVVNTCAIREKAEQKVFSFLGRLNRLKRRRPEMLVAVGGCVAQQQGAKIIERIPGVDVVFGTQAIGRLPAMINRIENERCRLVDIDASGGKDPLAPRRRVKNAGRVTRFVTIMQGCDNYCTYCVVPYVRGRESSRRPDDIIAEIRKFVEEGVREVTLLGQNVNSYGVKEGLCSFPELLARINAIDGLLRIRFTTSHPKDLSAELCGAFRDLPKLCRHIHLPVQSGSNRILERMNRRYTREGYLEKVAGLRKACPEIALSSDFIVGFPGETRIDFEQTLDLMRTVAYDSAFAFKYSDRPDAPARRLKNKVSEAEKNNRLQLLLETQDRITTAKNRSLVGTIQLVLVEGKNGKRLSSGDESEKARRAGFQWTGRTSANKIVNFGVEAPPARVSGNLTGRLVRVRIEKAYAHSLWGVSLSVMPETGAVKGENSYAA